MRESIIEKIVKKRAYACANRLGESPIRNTAHAIPWGLAGAAVGAIVPGVAAAATQSANAGTLIGVGAATLGTTGAAMGGTYRLFNRNNLDQKGANPHKNDLKTKQNGQSGCNSNDFAKY